MSGGGSVTSMWNKGHREDVGSCRPVRLISGPSKVLEQMMVRRMTGPREDS